MMFRNAKIFSSFSVDDLKKAREFYEKTLGLEAVEYKEMGLISIKSATGGEIMIYPKDNHVPATFTVLNFPVKNVDEAVDELVKKGVKFEIYEGFNQDKKGIARSTSPDQGPDIAWFKDPSGNILSVLQEK